MRVAVLYNKSGEDAAIAECDVLVQKSAVEAALERFGHHSKSIACTLDLAAVKSQLLEYQPDVVFNLVESLGRTDRLMALATLLLDALNLPYTGSPTASMLATTDKVTAKQRLRLAGLPTPAWFMPRDIHPGPPLDEPNCRVIIKSVWEHASFGIDEHAVFVVGHDKSLEERIWAREAATGRPYFAEQFIDGREFNLSMLDGPNGPQVLPAVEIDFSALPPHVPRIVGFRAKWESDSFEYQNTPRRFAFAEADAPLLGQLSQLARRCWSLFDLAGYARVDFRVDRTGQPWILEINANPCLSPDAGFAAALRQAGIEYERAIQRIVETAFKYSEARTY